MEQGGGDPHWADRRTEAEPAASGLRKIWSIVVMGPFQFRILTQSRRTPAVACIRLTPQKPQYNAKVRELSEGISDFLYPPVKI